MFKVKRFRVQGFRVLGSEVKVKSEPLLRRFGGEK